jgi:hypothetical protein
MRHREAIEFSQNGLGGFGSDEGFGAGIVLDEYALIAACRSAIERKTPRWMLCRVNFEKKLSTALSQETKVE